MGRRRQSPAHAAAPLAKAILTSGPASERDGVLYVAQDLGFGQKIWRGSEFRPGAQRPGGDVRAQFRGNPISLGLGCRRVVVEEAEEGYQSMVNLDERMIYPSADGIRNVIRLLGATNEKIRRSRK